MLCLPLWVPTVGSELEPVGSGPVQVKLVQVGLTHKTAQVPAPRPSLRKAQPLEILFIYYFQRERKEGNERERNVAVRRKHQWVASLMPSTADWPTTQAWALTRNLAGDLLLCGTTLSQLSHVVRAGKLSLKKIFKKHVW